MGHAASDWDISLKQFKRGRCQRTLSYVAKNSLTLACSFRVRMTYVVMLIVGHIGKKSTIEPVCQGYRTSSS